MDIEPISQSVNQTNSLSLSLSLSHTHTHTHTERERDRDRDRDREKERRGERNRKLVFFLFFYGEGRSQSSPGFCGWLLLTLLTNEEVFGTSLIPLHKVVFVVVFSFNLFCFALAHHS